MTGEPELSPVRKALLTIAVPAALLAAALLQLTVVNRLPLPDGARPDLVLLLVTAVAVTVTPTAGVLAGFAGGLALDVAPPATHYAGEYALVFCLAGFAAAWAATAIVNTTGERAPVTALTVMAAAAAAGEAGKAALGLLLSDPHVTAPAISRVLPGAVLADLLLAPLALALVRLAAGRGEPEQAPRPEFTQAQRLAPALRPASAGAVQDLRLAGTGTVRPQSQPPPRREPKLRLHGSRSPALDRTNAASSPIAQPTLAGGRTARLNFAGSGTGFRLGTGSRAVASFRTGGSALGPSLFPDHGVRAGRAMPPKGWLGRPQPVAVPQQVRRSSPGKGWLRAGGPAALAQPGQARRRPATPKFRASPPLPGAGGPAGRARSAGMARAAATARSAGRPGALAGGVRGAGQRTGPGRGWLRASPSVAAPPAPAVRRSPGRGWLRASPSVAAPPAPAVRRSPGRGWLRASRTPRRNWQASAPSRRWLRRSRARARWQALRRFPPLSRVLDLLPMGGRR